jgi:phosphoribosylformimino-5-aminoimidazole carboxamide ribotide isomerase
VTNFETSTSAGEFARTYKRDELPGGHVIMLSQDADSVAAARDALSSYPGGMHLGGGVTAENAAQYLDAGASHVIVTSYVFRDGGLDEDRLQRLVRQRCCAHSLSPQLGACASGGG